MISFCENYNITLVHSTTYYPQDNGLVESSKKSLISIIKKLLQENKKAWHTMTLALWVDRVSTKRAPGISPFEIVYGTNAIFPSSLGSPIMKLLQE